MKVIVVTLIFLGQPFLHQNRVVEQHSSARIPILHELNVASSLLTIIGAALPSNRGISAIPAERTDINLPAFLVRLMAGDVTTTTLADVPDIHRRTPTACPFG